MEPLSLMFFTGGASWSWWWLTENMDRCAHAIDKWSTAGAGNKSGLLFV